MFEPPVSQTEAETADSAHTTREPVPMTTLTDHVVLIGHGRVGRFVTALLQPTGIPVLVIEDNADIATRLRDEQGFEVIAGNATDPEVLAASNLGAARCLLVAVPDAFEGGQAVAQARTISQTLPVIARAHSEEEIEHLKKHGATMVVMGEQEIAKTMVRDLMALPA